MIRVECIVVYVRFRDKIRVITPNGIRSSNLAVVQELSFWPISFYEYAIQIWSF